MYITEEQVSCASNQLGVEDDFSTALKSEVAVATRRDGTVSTCVFSLMS